MLVLMGGAVLATCVILGGIHTLMDGLANSQRAPGTISSKRIMFELPMQLSLPPSYTAVIRSPSTNTDWLTELQAFLLKLPNKLVVMVSATSSFLEVLLNWLAFYRLNVKRPIEDVLIVALDEELYDTLKIMNLSTILMTKKDFVSSAELLKTHHSHVWIIRSAILRLLIHWGFNVAMIDIDALLLKDPFPLFEQYSSDIVATQGSYPFHLKKEWGVTMCMGTVLMRSTPGTGNANAIILPQGM